MFEDILKENEMTSHMEEAIHSAEYFLCGSQQSPIRINQDELQKLFEEDPKRLRDRWQPLKKGLQNTRRKYTFSLFAQTFFAVAAWLLTFIGSYVTSLGQYSEALLLSSGTLWTWLIPIVYGWMTVGTQSGKDTVQHAIQGKRINGASPLRALEARSGFMRTSTKTNEYQPMDVHDALWGSLQGDEARQGPLYNYARILTFPRLRDTIVHKFNTKVKPLPDHELQSLPNGPEDHNSAHTTASDSASSRSQATPTGYQRPVRNGTYRIEAGAPLNVTSDPCLPYMSWEDVLSNSILKRNFVASNAVAVLLQWGITGSAIVISYLTEVRGLGCRSGSYLIYGILATSAHILLLTSVFLLHHVMLICQGDPRTRRREPQTRQIGVAHNDPRSFHVKWIGRLAVFLRVCGKSLAVINAIWIILSSVFELIGFYNSCWCTGASLELQDKAWVVLFANGAQLKDEAQASWIAGLFMSSCTMVITYLVSKVFSKGREI
ncbi:hypothetical protein AA0111_g10456 [Alternaria arborescens]|uniref:hypothetical protein n=1 Tax=Alternaria arborescens TaxID=156630 RepID=UPI0010751995|nr:hypothetical protein AA0111_g10456 [Alternaria arborescens]RYO19282.1 hypothetical protein AA0111_g10456 [Alternaria arborescens]